jgi:hypothetical protein
MLVFSHKHAQATVKYAEGVHSGCHIELDRSRLYTGTPFSAKHLPRDVHYLTGYYNRRYNVIIPLFMKLLRTAPYTPQFQSTA